MSKRIYCILAKNLWFLVSKHILARCETSFSQFFFMSKHIYCIEKANFINGAALVSALSSVIIGFSGRECIQISRFSADE